MTMTINAAGDVIKIGKAFVSGKDRITVNGNVAFEKKLTPGRTERFTVGTRQYFVETRVISTLMGTTSTTIQIYEQDALIHSGIYDQTGKAVANQEEAKSTAAIGVCAMIGGLVGSMSMIFLNLSTGSVPGGAVGGGVGGAVGAMLGYGMGYLLFGSSTK